MVKGEDYRPRKLSLSRFYDEEVLTDRLSEDQYDKPEKMESTSIIDEFFPPLSTKFIE